MLRSNQRKAQPRQNGAVQQIERQMVITQLLKQSENYINGFRLGVRLTAESFQEKEQGKTEQRSVGLSVG